jgi:putative oxidoreductase
MAQFLAPWDRQIYAAMRIVAGLLFLFHGSQKLLNWPVDAMAGLPPFITYIAGPIELIGGTLVMIGLLTRWAAFFCSGLMAAAYWLAHGSKALYPMLNGGELAIMFSFVFLYIAARGAGIWSVDSLRNRA